MFILGHAGVHGNECADRLASLASFAEDRAMDQANVLNAV